MKLIILAAGQGTRLRPLTDNYPKCMVEYKGKAIIDYIIEAAKVCKLDDVTIVKGYMQEKLLRDGVKYYVNERYDITNMVATLFCAQEEMTDDVIISYADIIYHPRNLQTLIDADGDFCVLIDEDWRELWEERMDNPLDDAETLKLDADGNIRELGKKPNSYEEIQGQYMGLIKISKNVISEVRDFYYALDKSKTFDGKDFDNMYMTSFIQLIIDRLMPVRAVPVSGGWMEIDCVADLEYELCFDE